MCSDAGVVAAGLRCEYGRVRRDATPAHHEGVACDDPHSPGRRGDDVRRDAVLSRLARRFALRCRSRLAHQPESAGDRSEPLRRRDAAAGRCAATFPSGCLVPSSDPCAGDRSGDPLTTLRRGSTHLDTSALRRSSTLSPRFVSWRLFGWVSTGYAPGRVCCEPARSLSEQSSPGYWWCS